MGAMLGFDVVIDHRADFVGGAATGIAPDGRASQLDSIPAPDGGAGLRANLGLDPCVNGAQNTTP
jgi:hypothetical protein